MKKKIVVLTMLAAMLTMSLAACGNKGKVDSSPDSASGSNKDAKYQVGVIQLVQHPALDAATEGFEAALKDKLGDDVNVEIQNAAGEAATCATIANTYVTDGKDLILGNATAALQAATQATSEIPIVGTSITDYATALGIDDWKGATGSNVTGTSDLAPLEDQAKVLQELFPDAKNVGIVYCSAEPNSVYQADVITGYLEDMGYKVEVYTFSDSNDVSSVVKSACDNSDVLYIPTDNTAASCAETIGNVVVQEKTPVIAGEEGICGGCGVATLSIDYYDIGYAAGEMAYEILVNGAKPGEMDIQFAPEVTKKYNESICSALEITAPEDYEKIEIEEE